MKIIIILLIAAALISCNDEDFQQYTLGSEELVPDSLKPQMRVWVTETVRAGSYHLSAGDYEDPEDLISQAEQTAERLFSVRIMGLYFKETRKDYPQFIPKSELTVKEQQIFYRLLNEQ